MYKMRNIKINKTSGESKMASNKGNILEEFEHELNSDKEQNNDNIVTENYVIVRGFVYEKPT